MHTKTLIYPHLLVYWGNKGGGLRLFAETLTEIRSNGFTKVFVSTKEKNLDFLRNETNLTEANADFLQNIRASHVILRWPLITKWLFRKRIKSADCVNLKSLVVLMGSPGDHVLNSLGKDGISTTRVIHDIETHPGDQWPTKKAIARFLKAEKIVCLSDYVYRSVDHRNKYLSSLSRKDISFGISKPACTLPSEYFLIIGRFKKYKNLDALEEVVLRIPEKYFVFAGKGSNRFRSVPNAIVIDRWLSDSEIEWLVKNAKVLLAVYSEASQSGVVEQALFWQVPCIVSNIGGLPDQVSQQNLEEFIVESNDKERVVQILCSNLDLIKAKLPKYVPRQTLYETLSNLD